MRVIAGTAKGRRLKSVPGEGTRPITDRVKEALFNILAPQMEGARFLDLYAGTGSVGIEALSRGAESAVFVEYGRRAARVLEENLRLTEFQDRSHIIRDDVFHFLANTPWGPFDIIYIAPPQHRNLWALTLQSLDERSHLLALEGVAIAQVYPKEYQPLGLAHLALIDQRRYGSTLLLFYSGKAR